MNFSANASGRPHGFTIVELIVVIAVIGILVAITAIMLPNWQRDNRNQQRQSDVQQLAAALSTYANWENNFLEEGSGCGVNGNGNGWLNAGPGDAGSATLYPKSILQCLQEKEALPEGDFSDPSRCKWDSGTTVAGVTCGTYNGQPTYAYMKVTCRKDGNKATYVLASIEGMARKNAEVDALCDAGTVSGFTTTGQRWGTYYGMNYYVKVD